jgi:hypothetical protein
VNEVLHGRDISVSLNKLVDIYQLAGKYDIPGLRYNAIVELYGLVSHGLQKTSANTTFRNSFVDCVARVCGPDADQSADSMIRTAILDLCQENCLSLFQNKTFLQRYMRGELFDIQSATAFGIHLGARLLTSNGIPAEEAEGLLGTKNRHRLERYVMAFILPVSEARLIISFFKQHDQSLQQ